MASLLLTTDEVSVLLHRSKPQLQRDRDEGRLPFIKLGYSVRFRIEDIQRIAREGYFQEGAK